MYASYFKYLTCDISWDETTFINQFQFGQRNNVKDLMFTMLDLSTLNQAIAQGVRCDNKIFKFQQVERHWEPTPPTQWSFAPIMPP
jgi:hypothetical protein